MKYIFTMIIAAVAYMASAATVDGEGFPVFYVRGDFSGQNWGCDEHYRMTRSGNNYSIRIESLDGQFKISNDDWTVNYGGDGSTDNVVKGTCERTGVHNGYNFLATGLAGVSISFVYTANSPVILHITVDGDTGNGVSGTLPVLYINVRTADGKFDNEVIDKDLAHKNYFNGEYWLEAGDNSLGSADAPLPLEIKARGNFSRTAFAKKPFKLKLGSKQNMLGLSKSKHFALLAHADDNKGYLRNFTGFALGEMIGLPWTPSQKPVEVVINGDYRGLYFLTESVRVGDGRIPVAELADNESDPALVSGGYVVELDNYDEANQIRLDEKGQYHGFKDKLRITFDTPEEYSDIQRQFITDQFTAINDYIGENSDAVWSMLDLDDAARYYIVEELISHVEAYHGSTYLFRDRGEGRKWHFSPLWDCGNAFNGPTDGFFYDHAPYGCTWIGSLRLNDTFNRKVCEAWLWFMSNKFNEIYERIDAYVAEISAAARADRRRWAGAPEPAGGLAVADNSDMDRRRTIVVEHLRAKAAWLAGKFGDYTSGVFAEPARDTTPAAPLPEYISGGVVMPDVAADMPVEYYSLQGVRIYAPQPGGLYIMRRGNAPARLAVFR